MDKNYWQALKAFFEITFVVTGITVVCYFLLGQVLEITGDSMAPLLRDKEHILAEKISPKFTDFKVGDIIVFESPEDKNKLVIKRIVGLPNDTLVFKFGMVFLNQTILQEPYLPPNTLTKGQEAIIDGEPYKVPENTYFVLGDNRDASIDSRSWGVVKRENILGRALFVYKPINEFKLLF